VCVSSPQIRHRYVSGKNVDPSQLFQDERLVQFCAYCGAPPVTRDHVPGRVFLEKPYPDNLAVVQACKRCNNEISNDEEFVASLIACLVVGTATPGDQPREGIRRTLAKKPQLVKTLEVLLSEGLDEVTTERVRKTVTQYARGHVAFECGELRVSEPTLSLLFLLDSLPNEERAMFESIKPMELYPEIGSRKFIQHFGGRAIPFDEFEGWYIVQSGSYRYAVELGREYTVKIVLGECLGAVVSWAKRPET